MALTSQSPASAAPPTTSVAQRAKNALRRLALDKLEPTPENYAIAYRLESGGARPPAVPAEALALVHRLAARALGDDGEVRAANFCKALADAQWERAGSLMGDLSQDGRQLATLIDRLVRAMERGGRQWTLARKKESLQRVLDSSRANSRLVQSRLSQLLGRWEDDVPDAPVETEGDVRPADADDAVATEDAVSGHVSQADVREPADSAMSEAAMRHGWEQMLSQLVQTMKEALPLAEPTGREVARQFDDVAERIRASGPTPELVEDLAEYCANSTRLLQHRHHLVIQLGGLCQELTHGLTELAEDDSWAKGQCEAMRITLEDGITARGVKSVTELLRTTRQRQSEMRHERDRARGALKSLITRMLGELSELGTHTGRFNDSVGRYADVIEKSESLEALTGVVSEMVDESRAVQSLVAQTQKRLNDEHAKATDLSQKVTMLEGELNRLSSEVSTDQLTQVANRRGLLREFEVARSRAEREGEDLAIGLLDIDNFKRLNDQLGHNAGDVALRSLAAAVKKSLRPSDTVARYGGEEFVVLLPEASAAEAQQVLTRLQRNLSGGLFMHEQKSVMVTFSAGVTLYRAGERIEDALERADQALFEAKRQGKNRTCAA